MNTPRRSMNAALQPSVVTPEVMAIIMDGTPKPQAKAPAVTVDSLKEPVSEVAKPALEITTPSRPRAGKERPLEIVSLVSTNFRIPAQIPAALLRASSERKIKKIHPFTQQDIVAEALTAWLQKNGFQV